MQTQQRRHVILFVIFGHHSGLQRQGHQRLRGLERLHRPLLVDALHY